MGVIAIPCPKEIVAKSISYLVKALEIFPLTSPTKSIPVNLLRLNF